MEFNGKVYRNLEGQVGYLTDKYDDLQNQINELRAQIPSKMIVEELPEEGDPLITYYVGPKGTEPNLYYEVWVWVQEEPDGPFVWRELEDTDQVDLSGYLEKNTAISGYSKRVYGTSQSGDVVSQVMLDATDGVYGSVVVLRDGNGQIAVPETPSADGKATSKKYVNDNFVAKQTGTTTCDQVYIKTHAGTQSVVDINRNETAGNTLVQRTQNGQVTCTNPTADEHSINLGYANDHYLAKQTRTSGYDQVYVKGADGTQSMLDIVASSAQPASLVKRASTTGQIFVPETPTANGHAASKAYVDAAVGQLLYLHDIEIIVTVDATNKLYIKAYLINGSATAITSIDTATFKRMDVQYGCFGVDVDTGTPCAVTKKPDSFVYGNFTDPRPSYLYQYISGGTLQAYKTTNSMAVTVTDTVISF